MADEKPTEDEKVEEAPVEAAPEPTPDPEPVPEAPAPEPEPEPETELEVPAEPEVAFETPVLQDNPWTLADVPQIEAPVYGNNNVPVYDQKFAGKIVEE